MQTAVVVEDTDCKPSSIGLEPSLNQAGTDEPPAALVEERGKVTMPREQLLKQLAKDHEMALALSYERPQRGSGGRRLEVYLPSAQLQAVIDATVQTNSITAQINLFFCLPECQREDITLKLIALPALP